MTADLSELITPHSIAVVGMAGRFPGAGSVDDLWRNLCKGVESIRFFSADELRAEGVDEDTLADPAFVPAYGELDGIELFDAAFFGYSPREAELLDPQHRLFLEIAMEALERANIEYESHPRVSVFAGSAVSTYLIHNLLPRRDLLEAVGVHQVILGNDKDYLATRVAYHLGLTGSACTVQSACSTSLVAVHFACRSLITHEADAAIAGGVTVAIPQRAGYFSRYGDIAAPDGHTRAFDARAEGTVGGSGVCAVVLKRLADAIADRDVIRAVLLSTATNNDGSAKVGFTAPSVSGQEAVIADALDLAGVSPDAIGYIEAHGTGTALGDPVEVTALSRAFGRSARGTQFCALGSIKTNLGHLDAAAGLAGLIKAVLCVEHGLIPPSLNFRTPNPAIDFAHSPFQVADQLRQWPADGHPRLAGVSSFGLGGTNVHAVVSEPPPPPPSRPSPRPQLLLLSAESTTALDAMSDALAGHLHSCGELDIADVAHTLAVGRRQYVCRRAVLCESVPEAVRALEEGRTIDGNAESEPGIVFMFPGSGTHSLSMGRELYQLFPAYRDAVDECADLLAPLLGRDLRGVVGLGEASGGDPAALARPSLSLPAVFVAEHALAELLSSWHVRPTAMIGYSLGEYAMACQAGVMTPADALRLVALRGQLLERVGGSMLSVRLGAEQLDPLPADLSLAAINSATTCMLAGPNDAVKAYAAELLARDVQALPVEFGCGAHSWLLDSVLPEYRAALSSVTFSPPTRPYLSCVTGTYVLPEELCTVDYWARNFREPVRFAAALDVLTGSGAPVLVEVGPGQSLSAHVKDGREEGPPVIAPMPHPRRPEPEAECLLKAVARLWVLGARLRREALTADEVRRRVELPPYPLDRRRYWLGPPTGPSPQTPQAPQAPEIPQAAQARQAAPRAEPVADESPADWFFAPTWHRTPPPPTAAEPVTGKTFLVLRGTNPVDAEFAGRLVRRGAIVVEVYRGERFEQIADHGYTIAAQRSDDYRLLLAELNSRSLMPEHVVHMWLLTDAGRQLTVAESERVQVPGFYSLLHFGQAVETFGVSKPLRIDVVTAGAHAVTGIEALAPASASVLGACRVLPQEYSYLTCRNIDIEVGSESSAGLAERIERECLAASGDCFFVAYRGPHRWVSGYNRVRLPRPPEPAIRQGGLYLITGGLDVYGASLARHVCLTRGATIVSIEHESFPAEDDWEGWLVRRPGQDPWSQRIRAIRELRDLGASVRVRSVDIASAAALTDGLRAISAEFGSINGVFHTAGIEEEQTHRLVRDSTIAVCQEHFRRRVHSTLALAEALDGMAIDFCLVQTVLSSHLGGLGRMAASAAAAVAELTVHQTHQQPHSCWLTASWDDGKFELPGARGTAPAAPITPPFDADDVGEVVDRLAGSVQLIQLVVTKKDLMPKLDYWIGRRGFADTAQADDSGDGKHPRPERLPSAFEQPRNNTEAEIAAIWQLLLGVEPIGVHDDFFALGGHSLLATQLISRLRRAFEVDFPLRDLFEAPTVAGMAAKVVQLQAALIDPDTLESLLDQLERLVDDDTATAGPGGE